MRNFRLSCGIVLFLISIGLHSIAQNGAPYVVNFPIDQQYRYKVWDMAECENGEMLFACRKGLLSYNGSDWKLHSVPSIPFALGEDKGKAYVGLQGDLGQVAFDSTGSYVFYSFLDDSIKSSEVYGKTIQTNNGMVFISESDIALVDSSGKVSEIILHDSIFPIQGIWAYNGILQLYSSGYVYSYINDSIVQDTNVYDTLINDIVFDFKYNDSILYFGTLSNNLYKFDGKSMEKVKLKDQRYFDETILSGGVLINDSLAALSTNIGGVLVVNLQTGKTKYTINYSSGLPDDEVFDIYKDKHNGIWISHGRGISRIDFSLSIINYAVYPGLRGSINTFSRFNNKLYVGTSKGVYVLDKVENFKEEKVKVKVKKKFVRKVPVKKEEPKVQEPVEEQKSVDEPEQVEEADDDGSKKKKKRGRMKRFFNRVVKKVKKPLEKKEEKPEKKIEVIDEPQEREEIVTRNVFQTKTIYKLQSISHKFKKVGNFDDKCIQLLRFKDQLLAASNTGLYCIKNNKASVIARNIYINSFQPSRIDSSKLLIASKNGIISIHYERNKWRVNKDYPIDEEVFSVEEANDSSIWAGGTGYAYKVSHENTMTYQSFFLSGHIIEKVLVRNINNKMRLILPSGIYYYNETIETLVPDSTFRYSSLVDIPVISTQPGFTWLKTEQWDCFKDGFAFDMPLSNYLELFDNIDNIKVDTSGDLWVVDEMNNLYRVSKPDNQIYIPEFLLNVKSVRQGGLSYIKAGDVVLSYKNNQLNIRISSPFFLKSNGVEYQYKLKGLMDDWSEWSKSSEINFPFIPPGKYELKICSRTILGNKSDVTIIPIVIEKPFWQTTIFYALVSIVFFTLVIILIKLRERKLVRDKIILEQKVKERTRTISEQKEEIEAQRDTLAEQNEEILQQKEEITAQRDEIEVQKDRIEAQHTDIKKSIQYAQRIQSALLPTHNYVSKLLKEYFILFKPRDIVSGDFYWINEIDGKIIVAVADCTGHGVPGAFMSMLGVSFLNEITAKPENLKAHLILNELRRYVKETLSQEAKESETKDGMDISLMIFDLKKNKAEFAGAFNSLYMIRKGELSEIKADKMPVGIYLKEKDSFTNNEIELEKGDVFYMLSDGFPDQFGGPNGKKFMRKPFKRILTDNWEKPLDKQKEILENEFTNWLGNRYKQTDDVLVIGVRI